MGLFGENEKRVKFLCSHGGKILPRPSDGQLKYVGGETRLIAVPTNITFSELMNKLNNSFKSNVDSLKYQLIAEDLDALVSVTCDEDLRNMFSELYVADTARSRDGRNVKMRAFLFPSTPTPITTTKDAYISNTDGDPDEGLEQRYIEAINGIVRTSSDLGPSTTYSIFSSGSSQNSPKGVGDASDAPSLDCCQELQRVHSSTNLLRSDHQKLNRHQLYHLSRLRRPGTPLTTSRSDVARYNVDQLARRYRTPVFYCREGSEWIGIGQPNGLNVNRSGGLGEGKHLPRRPVKRWGSPLRRSSNRQD
ncbi:hypothetical protein CKAN_02188800 [Cinnamomum micranthum f. kanehirae]|uniref:PB1 domain-containing protein n=1 Tax=Cinnamomum micranthum f. kanehirae TaxID=337451 RepID=A0A3S3PKI1_9MAGN|nr:hypothetical protein CKAN_02188800 [Cinnamomum micranthum f. kanehirae]